MLQTKLKFPTIYNPASQSPEEIVSNFVIRLREFDELFQAIKNDKMEKPPQHFIIQGQRGYGKTTLLLRLNHEIINDSGLNQWLLPVMFGEEQYNIQTLAKLWEEVIDILEDRYDSFAGLSDKVDPLYDSGSPEEKIFELLIEALKTKNKKIVLFLDNFGDMIEKFSRKENQRLREILITCKHIRIVGTSSAILEFYYNYREPLYDFFKVITLDALNREETVQLLKKLSETYGADEINKIIESQPERIEALRRLTGGVPRTIVLLFEIFVDDVDGNSFKDLETILDRVTPLYKHRMDSLSKHQQAIVDALAQNWDALSTKDIAKKVRMPSKAVSSQLNQLEKSQLVVKISTSTKNQLYQISERFFNIYYLMRLGRRKNRNRVLWLVRFFELWCSENELVERAQRHIKSLRDGKLYQPHAYWISQALSRTRIPDEIQHELITQTREYLSSAKNPLAKELDKSHIEVRNEASALIESGDIDSAERNLLKEGISKDRMDLFIANALETKKKDFARALEFYLKAIKGGNVNAMFNLALLYHSEYKNYEEAKKYYLMAVEKGHAGAMYNLALLYGDEYKNYEEAKKYYLMAVEKGHANAMNNLALLYENEYKNYEEAKKYYLMAVEKGHAGAMYNLALLYGDEYKNYEEAKKYYLMAVEKGHANAMNNLAVLYQNEYKNYEEAKKYYLMAVEKGDAGAMYNLALLYHSEYKSYEEAKKYYLMAVEKGDANAMNNLALLYENEYKNYEEAKKYYLMAVEKGDANAMYNLALLYQNEYKEYDEAEKYYLMAIERGNVNANNNLANLYFKSKKKKEEALKLQREIYTIQQDMKISSVYLKVLLWNNDIEEARKVYGEYFDKEDVQKDVTETINSILLMFLAKKQYNFVYQLFEENKYNLKDKYKPIYFALLSLLGEERKDEYLKMGPELKETVDEVISEIRKLEVDYA